MRTEARFPSVARTSPHHESFFLKAAAPGGGRGIWIRHTVLKAAGEQPAGAVWLTLFDANAPAPTAVREGGDASMPDGEYIRIGGSVLEPGAARGSAGAASWDLTFSDAAAPLRHLPRDVLYRGPLPRTKLLSPYPSARFHGEVAVAGEHIAVDGWPGVVGHNWGAGHADRWIWVQAPGAGPLGFFELAAARIAIGPIQTPWLAAGGLRIDGETIRLGGIARRGTRIAERPASCEFVVGGDDVVVRGRVSADERRFVTWPYEGPDGSTRRVLNCSIADLQLTVERGDADPVEVYVEGAAAYELGTRVN